MTRFPFYNEFKWDYTKEFHRLFKPALHAMRYGSAKATAQYYDFIHMYIGGGEL